MAKPPAELPTKEQIISYIESSALPFSKRELAKAFNIKGDLRVPFKQLLRELLASGVIKKKNHLPPQPKPDSPNPDFPKHDLPKSEVKIPPKEKSSSFSNKQVIVIFQGNFPIPHAIFVKRNEELRLTLEESDIRPEPGDMILVEITTDDRYAFQGKIIKILEKDKSSDSFAMMTILSKEIPHIFSQEARELAKGAKPVTLGKREDLTKIPLVTIDGEDAKDFDDAVYAKADDHPNNLGGWHLIVAIADVAHYVQPGDPLDREAYERGNSVYFPGTVVPMLPEELSNELCSLKPSVERASLAVHMWIDGKGKLLKYKFSRALIKSYARLTYTEVESVLGKKDHVLAPIIEPLYQAFKILRRSREYRGALNIESRENKIIFNNKNEPVDILAKQQLISHTIIEEFMVLANVAAAQFLEEKKLPCMYRIHPKPDPVKAQALRDFLLPLQLLTSGTQLSKSSNFNDLLRKVKDSPLAGLVNDMVLRTQSQAVYSPKNIGHFGLALDKYAHFTSPIRRYSDLIVHRSILTALSEEDGHTSDLLGHSGLKKLEDIGVHISSTERRAAEAEREVAAKYIAEIMQANLGNVFEARITSVQSFGFFVTVTPQGVDGLVHIRTLSGSTRDYFIHDPKRHILRGERSKKSYALGDQVMVKLISADILSGKLSFELEESPEKTSFVVPVLKKKKKLKKERFQSR